MEAPPELRTAAAERSNVTIARREYADGTELVVDFGGGVDASVDVVGDTAIVVAGDQQFEFPVPDEAREVLTNDGVLVIRE